MTRYVIIGAEHEINEELRWLLDRHSVTFDYYPGRDVMQQLAPGWLAVFVTLASAEEHVSTLAAISAYWPELPVICIGSNWSPEEQMRTLAFGARANLNYPILPSCLSSQLARARRRGVVIELPSRAIEYENGDTGRYRGQYNGALV